MRTCLRCGSEMQENCAVKVEGAGYGIVLSNKADKLFGGRIGQPRVAICPQCGEVSIYLADTDRLGGRIGQPRVAICPQCGEVSIYLADTDRLQKP